MKLSRFVQLPAGATPHVEVVVPCYNYGHYLPQCVESILRQAGVRTTVTIVDDASTDDSVLVAERLAGAHPGVRLIRNETNLGHIRTYNVGLREADSDYVVLLSADDMLAPGALWRAAALMEAHPTVGFTFGHAQKFATEPSPRAPMPAVTWATWLGEEWIELQMRRGWNNISSPEVVVRTTVQHAVGYYNPDLPHSGDVEMWLRIAAVADVGHVNGVDQAYYRRHASNLSTGYSGYRDIEERWRAYEGFLSDWSRTDDAVRLGAVMRRRLSDEVLFDLLRDLDRVELPAERVDWILELAHRIDPDVVGRGPWADAQVRRAGGRPRGISPAVRSAGRELAAWTRWHRWRRFRYLG
ncbi:glycosyltransferase family 2 protein [Agromyces cerinus]|uniref:Glycosyl transferase family 2 n=1 Tax=Agromyces cerinus subsp. cerinus TaxID=232089 RepID=A0A1N6F6B8_9MICO|nr:glycosyltransferase family 2 protein [Agromyces cerinus]SIN90848.1 Glycosyl transferase family 2 [Agromyces cerinus subsp. cerinus]